MHMQMHGKTRVSNTNITKEIHYLGSQSPPRPPRQLRVRASVTADLDAQIDKLSQERKQGVEAGRINGIGCLRALNELRLFDIELSSQKMKSTICDQQCVTD